MTSGMSPATSNLQDPVQLPREVTDPLEVEVVKDARAHASPVVNRHDSCLRLTLDSPGPGKSPTNLPQRGPGWSLSGRRRQTSSDPNRVSNRKRRRTVSHSRENSVVRADKPVGSQRTTHGSVLFSRAVASRATSEGM